MSFSIISTLNLVETFRPTVNSGGDPDFPFTNVLDGLTWTIAKDPSATAADFIFDFGVERSANSVGLAGHNLYQLKSHLDGSNGAQFEVYVSDNGVDFTSVYQSGNVLTAMAPFALIPGGTRTSRYWLVRVWWQPNVASELFVGVIWLGTAITFEQGIRGPFSPPGYDRNNQLLSNFGGGGQVLGTGVLREGGQTQFAFRDLTWNWFETQFGFRYEQMIAGNPFMVSWDTEGHAEQSAYCIAPTNPVVTYRSHGRLDFTINALTV